MIVCNTSNELDNALSSVRSKKQSVGFVPTMGALHQGHISLIQESKKKCDVTVCSIFVNPTQFNDAKDFEKYPSTIQSDSKMLSEAHCDILFVPDVKEIYPKDYISGRNVPLGRIATVMEAKYRKGHFEGVMQVVKILLDKVKPHYLFVGAKDFQQCAVIKCLIEYFKIPVKLVVCPTMRESDGLAMSSRNLRLTQTQRIDATILSHVLLNMHREWEVFSPHELKHKWMKVLKENDKVRVEYLEIVDVHTLVPIRKWESHDHVQACIAVQVGEVRLIDNVNIF